MSFNGKITIAKDLKYGSTVDVGTALHSIQSSSVNEWTTGELINQAEVLWADERTLAIATLEDLDLSGTTLQDAFGADVAFTSIKVMLITASSDNDDNIVVGGSALNAWESWVGLTGSTVNISPGGTLCLISGDAAGYLVTAGSADQLQIDNSSVSSTGTYTITLIGLEA